MASRPEPVPFRLERSDGGPICGEEIGAGRDLVLCHGLSATRRYVVHGSLYLPRHGYRLITYDARGHGESAPGAASYAYEALVEDLELVRGRLCPDGVIMGGHSMGCHTVAAEAIRGREGIEALILIGPVYAGETEDPELDRWDARADALEHQGAGAFADQVADDMPPGEARDRVWNLARDRARLHLDPRAVAEALRQVPRSRPFGGLDDLAGLELPVLVVGSRDELDPGHPLAVARAWAEAIPGAEFAVEEPGQPPLAWQGGRLSRIINDFLSDQGLGG